MLFVSITNAAEPNDVASSNRDSSALAIKLFEEICFKNYAYPAKRAEILNTNFEQYEDQNKAVFLNMFGVEQGAAWSAKFPSAVFSIVLDYKKNNCYIASPEAPKKDLHNLVKGMSENAKIKYKDGITYIKPKVAEDLKSSGFKVSQKNKRLMNVVAVTQQNPVNNRPAIMLALEAY